MNDNEVLQALAAQHELDAHALLRYAEEDAWFGWEGESDYLGSVWPEEGRVLYALVRYLKPDRVYEFGTSLGVSTTHIAAAIARNGSGDFVSIDIDPSAGSVIPDPLRAHVTLVTGDAALLDCEPCAFVFEDASHEADLVAALTQKARGALRDGGFCVHHDAMHYLIGDGVRAGIERGGITSYTAFPTGRDNTPAGIHGVTGLAVWRKGVDDGNA